MSVNHYKKIKLCLKLNILGDKIIYIKRSEKMNNNFNQTMPNEQPMNGMPNNMNMGYGYPYAKTNISAIVGYIACGVMAVSIFMPFLSYDGIIKVTQNFFTYGSGAIILALAVVSAFLIFAKKHMCTVLTAVPALIILISDFIKISDAKAKIGFGVWTAGVGIIALLVSAILYWRENPNCLSNIIKLRPRQPMAFGTPMNQNYGPQPMNNQPTTPVNNGNQNPNQTM